MVRRLMLAAAVALLTAGGGSVPFVRVSAQSPQAAVTFTRDVAPILHAKCASCHRPGEAAPMPLLTYQDARPRAVAIKAQVTSRKMPPWFADPAHGTFANDPTLTSREIETIANWVDAGAPQGDPKHMPALPRFTDGWQLGEPDYIVELPEVQIPAAGKDIFPTPNIAIDLAEDRWIRAMEIRPSNRQVAHHAVIFSSGISNAQDLRDAATGGIFDVLGVWAVGTPPQVYPDGMGRWIRKGQTLRTNLHYHPNGTPQTDRIRVGFYFGKGELKKEVVTGVAGNLGFAIPPHAGNHELQAMTVVDQDITVVSYFPHMHLRGKDMTITATYPDGRTETLLGVPAYDFNWQLFYYPKRTITLPRGTRIDAVAHYDNSTANKDNPDPAQRVTFGEDSTAEMMFGVFEYVATAGVTPRPSTGRSQMEALSMTLARESTYLVDLPFSSEPTPSLFSLAKTGTSAFYMPGLAGMIMAPAVQQLQWEGNTFSFQTAVLAPGNPGSGFYNVTGEIREDGTIRGTMRRRGNGQPPSYDFTGRTR